MRTRHFAAGGESFEWEAGTGNGGGRHCGRQAPVAGRCRGQVGSDRRGKLDMLEA